MPLPENQYTLVYNLEVADFHTYYVANSSILVHNTKECLKSNISTNTELGSITGYKKKDIDIDFRNTGKTYKDALEIAFEKTGIKADDFAVTKWAKNPENYKSYPVQWNKGTAEISIDAAHTKNGPDVPHVGFRYGKKQDKKVVHIFLDSVPYHR